MFTQKSINIFHSVQEIRPFSLFQNLAIGKASTDDKCHFAIVSLFQNLNLGKNSTNLKCHLTISWGTSCQYQCACKISSQYSTQFKMLHIEVRLPVLLCAVKTVEGDFRFCWTTAPNVGQTHKENPNLVRILYMVCTLNDIYKQYNKLH